MNAGAINAFDKNTTERRIEIFSGYPQHQVYLQNMAVYRALCSHPIGIQCSPLWWEVDWLDSSGFLSFKISGSESPHQLF